MASPLSVVHPTSFSHLFSKTFFRPRPFSPAPLFVSFNCFFSSSSTAAMTSPKTIVKSTSCQTNTTVPSYNAHSLKAAIFKTFALKVGSELNNGTIAPSARRVSFKIMYNVFLLSSKNIPYEKYYRLHLSGPTIAICETKSSNVFVQTLTSFDRNNFYFLHAVQKLSTLLTRSLRILACFSGWLLMTRPNTLLSPTLQPILNTSNLASCSSLVLFFADFLRSFVISFADFLRIFVIFFAGFLRSFAIFLADFYRSFIFFADFPQLPSTFFAAPST